MNLIKVHLTNEENDYIMATKVDYTLVYNSDKTAIKPFLVCTLESGREMKVGAVHKNAHLFPCEYEKYVRDRGIPNPVGKHHVSERLNPATGEYEKVTEETCGKH